MEQYNYYPKTYKAAIDRQSNFDRAEIFEPALKQFRDAFRMGDPIFHDRAIRSKWLEARQQVIDRLLQVINNSHWRDNLVLRGSLLLKAWLGDKAREAGDIDWVFQPQDVDLKHPLATQLFDDLKQMMSENYRIGEVTIETYKITTDDIWTYERAEGRRIVFPWKCEGLPAGSLQMDVVFCESLPEEETIETPIPTFDNRSILVRSVTKQLSLAWKLLWLQTDNYPQGKDLYDATILAENTSLPLKLLAEVLQSNPEWNRRIAYFYPNNFSWQSEFPWLSQTGDLEYLDWDNFKLEYPLVEGEAKDWLARLKLALETTFSAS